MALQGFVIQRNTLAEFPTLLFSQPGYSTKGQQDLMTVVLL